MEAVLPTWLGSFYGSDFTYQEYEVRAINNFYSLSTPQSRCIECRWFDYVRLHPLQATYYFVDCYRKISSQLSKRYFGKDTRGVSYEDFLDSRERTSFWNMRSFCDMYGMAYPWFIYQVMEYLLESGKFKNRLPRPQHFLSNVDMELAALGTVWQHHLNGEILRYSYDPYFLVSNWEGSRSQRRHEDMLIDQIKQKTVKRYALSTLIYEQQVLRFERAVKEFPRDIEDAMRVCEQS